jgi:branched-subunit amino acid ABC-type transport system permease component
LEEHIMRGIVKWLIAVALGAVLSGCVVAPVGPPRPYVGVGVVAPAPVVVVGGGYYHRW